MSTTFFGITYSASELIQVAITFTLSAWFIFDIFKKQRTIENSVIEPIKFLIKSLTNIKTISNKIIKNMFLASKNICGFFVDKPKQILKLLWNCFQATSAVFQALGYSLFLGSVLNFVIYPETLGATPEEMNNIQAFLCGVFVVGCIYILSHAVWLTEAFFAVLNILCKAAKNDSASQETPANNKVAYDEIVYDPEAHF